MAELLSEVAGTSISGRGSPPRDRNSLNWLPAHHVGARLSGLSRSDFVTWPISTATRRTVSDHCNRWQSAIRGARRLIPEADIGLLIFGDAKSAADHVR